MDPTQRLQIANRIHLDLMREIGQGIDLRQMLDSELYARDVLLVCQAFAGHELQQLGRNFAGTSQHPEMPDTLSATGQASAPVAVASTTTRAASAGSVRPTPHHSRWLHPWRWFAAWGGSLHGS